MAGTMRKVAQYLGLVEEDEAFGLDPANDGQAQRAASRPSANDTVRVVEKSPERPIWRSETPAAATEVKSYRPASYNDAREFGEEYRAGSPVALNISALSEADAKRIVDFGAGLVFGLRGAIERLDTKLFLLVPAGAEVSDQTRDKLKLGL